MKKSIKNLLGKEVNSLQQLKGGNDGSVRHIVKGPGNTTVIIFGDLTP